MTITATVIADSVGEFAPRLTTMQLRYPRWIHAEFLTHRVFSRNSSSSRAIPVDRLIDDVLDDLVAPSVWGKNRPGMQAIEELTEPNLGLAKLAWDVAREDAVRQAQKLRALGVHKQIVNRILEPFVHINTVVSATKWDNFFALRDHTDAQPEIRELAQAMRAAMDTSTPAQLYEDEWHAPYHSNPRASAARCARVSYLTHDGREPDLEEDLLLFDRLLASQPAHASPAEHQARPDSWTQSGGWARPDLHGNLEGWVQHRKLLSL
jgi:hypothetical protein